MATKEEILEGRLAIAQFLEEAWEYSEDDVFPENYIHLNVDGHKAVVYCDTFNLVAYSLKDKMIMDINTSLPQYRKIWAYARKRIGRYPKGFIVKQQKGHS